MIFLPHTNTVILLEPYCGTITEPGLPVVSVVLSMSFMVLQFSTLDGKNADLLFGLL